MYFTLSRNPSKHNKIDLRGEVVEITICVDVHGYGVYLPLLPEVEISDRFETRALAQSGKR